MLLLFSWYINCNFYGNYRIIIFCLQSTYIIFTLGSNTVSETKQYLSETEIYLTKCIYWYKILKINGRKEMQIQIGTYPYYM